MSQNKIVQQILNALNKESAAFRDFYYSGNSWQGDWTEKLKRVINNTATNKTGSYEEMGFDKQLHVCASTKHERFDGGEWLFDISWIEMNDFTEGEFPTMKSIPLVLESEISCMGWGDFKVDFDKLLLATSSTKIFVTRDLKNPKQHEHLSQKIKYAQKAIDTFTNIRQGHGVYGIIWDEASQIKDNEFFKSGLIQPQQEGEFHLCEILKN